MLEDAKTKLGALKSLLRNMSIRKHVKNDLNFQNKMNCSILIFFKRQGILRSMIRAPKNDKVSRNTSKGVGKVARCTKK
jgi:hypothetical protein